ncbi:MAG: hypothetical protein HYY06_01185 [Deltaproteobacteria bacterium]|nr:hypothetical protein [Deltaproteobacteria bacterium]
MRRAGYLVSLLAVAACSTSPSVSPERREAALEAGKGDVLYAASSVLRVVQGAGVVARLDLRRTVTQIAFDPDGKRAFVATSDGVHVVDGVTHRELRRLTRNPARSVVVSASQEKVWVLENTVRRLADGHNEPLPFHVRRFDLDDLREEADVEVGDRMLAMGIPAAAASPLLMITEGGALALLRYPAGSAEPLASQEQTAGRVRIGPVLDRDGKTLYVPVEGEGALVLAVDVDTKAIRPIELGRAAYLRALALSPDGETLYVNALTRVAAVDLSSSTRTVRWGPDLPSPHQALAVSPDGSRLYLARPVDSVRGGGAITTVDASTLEAVSSTHIDGVSPFALAVRP